MKKIMSLIALAAIITLSSFMSGRSTGNGPFNSIETTEVQGSFFNECTGEFVNYTGTVHTNVFGMFRANKIFVNYHSQYSFVGVGATSGKTYRANQQDHYSESSTATGSSRMQVSSTANWITSGNKNNFTTTSASQVSVNSRGEVTVNVEDPIVNSCR
jgi:hypothetical protein